jgi:tetratricopeptide (TPR) repeat protein
MIKRLTLFLGPARMQALFFLLAGTGLASLILNAFVKDNDSIRAIQSLLVLVFAVGGIIIVGGKFEPEERGRLGAIILPAIGAVILGLLVLPGYLLPLMGAAAGWVIAGVFLFRPKTRMEYQAAVKHLRKNEYAEAVKVMDGVIKDEPGNVQHYRFRAELLRLWGKLDRARRDYQQMAKLEPESAIGYNGLAEVYLQEGDFPAALDAANKAYSLAPDEWVAAYNLGMIEDRLLQSDRVIEHLRKALDLNVPDARHRLLIHLYLARAYSRKGDIPAAQAEIQAMKKQGNGLKEWEMILDSDQAATLREVLGADVETARKVTRGETDAAALAGGKAEAQ